MTTVYNGRQENTFEITNTKVAWIPTKDPWSLNKCLHDFSTERYGSTADRFSAK